MAVDPLGRDLRPVLIDATAPIGDTSGKGNDRWWLYDETGPAPDVRPLLAAIDDDVTGIFWG